MTEVDLIISLGRGNFSTITMVIHEGQSVVRKRATTRLVDGIEEDTIKDLDNEYRILCQLHHPHIISPIVRKDTLEGDREFLLPLYSMDLNHYIQKQYNPPSSLVMKFISQLSSALNHIHELGIVHCDVKPANILCDLEKEIIVLIDFGFAEKETPDDAYHRRNGEDDYARGSLLYMAPERVHHPRLFSRFSDMWSWALVGYFLFARAEPWFNYHTKRQFMRDLSENRLISQLSKPEHCPALMWELFRSCWVYPFASRPSAKTCQETIQSTENY